VGLRTWFARTGFRFKQRERSPQHGDGICDALRMGAQDPDARVAAWRVEPDVGEVEVEGYEYSRLIAADIQNLRIGATAEALLKCSLYFVPGISQQRTCIPRKVFIQLEASGHPLQLCGNRHYAFASEIGSVGNGCRNVLRLERGVLVENALWSLASGKIVEHNRNRYPGSPEALSAVHDLGIGGDIGFPVHGSLLSLSVRNIAPCRSHC
jgi:hypothetical protein